MEQEQTISLQELFQVLKKRLFLIVSITIVAVAISAAVSYFVMTPVYQATTTLMALNDERQRGNNSWSDYQTDLKLINTYNDLIKSDLILEQVLQELDMDMTAGQLAGKISVANNKESHVIKISVKDADPHRAAEIANKTAEVLEKEVYNTMNTRIKEISKAKVSENQSPVEPKPLLNIAIAGVIGLMAGVGLAFLLEFLDNTIKTEQDLENTLGLPVIGVIMDINEFMNESEARQAARTTHSAGGETIGS